MRFFLSLLIVMFAVSTHAKAGDVDAGLYDPLPPAGSAFVRFVNLQDENLPAKAKGKNFGSLDPATSSSYKVISKGEADIQLGGQTGQQALEEGKLYSVVSIDGAEQPEIITDPVSDNRAKALISFYNFTETPLELKTTDKNISVIDAVSKGEVKSREINPVKVALGVYEGDTQKQALEPILLERGQSYSVFYSGGKPLVVQGQTDTTQ